MDSDTFVRIALASIPWVPDITRDELLELIRRVREFQCSEYEDTFWRSVLAKHLNVSLMSEYCRQGLSVEEALDKALTWKPIELPPSELESR
jgi:hypothetical protein